MRYAKSLLYGGMLVDATNADYQDYSRLLLKCPFCGEAVYLSGSKHRPEHARLAPKTQEIVLVKAANVAAAFCHFPGVVSGDCERKSLGITHKDIQRHIARSRNQRLKFFQQKFWKIVKSDREVTTLEEFYTEANPLLREDKETILEMAVGTRRDIAQRFRNFKDVPVFANNLIMRAREDKSLIHAKTEDERDRDAEYLGGLEIDLHLQIVAEAAEFLKTKSASVILNDFIDLAASNAASLDRRRFLHLLSVNKNLATLEKDYQQLATMLMASIVALLAGVKWAIAMNDDSLRSRSRSASGEFFPAQ